MVTVYIDADEGNGNVESVGTFSVTSFQECLEFMYNTWIKCNVSSETYEFKVSASSPFFKNSDKVIYFDLGKYVVPRKSNKVDIFSTDSDESIEEFDLQGFSTEQQKNLNDYELFKARFEFLLNPNNHHRIIGKWLSVLYEDLDLDSIIETSTGLADVSDEKYGNVVLASLLHFANEHQKSIEMLDWLASKQGSQYLSHFDKFNTVAPILAKASQEIQRTIAKTIDKKLAIDDFLNAHFTKTIPLPELL